MKRTPVIKMAATNNIPQWPASSNKRLTFPYFAQAATLPAPLPTMAEILAAKDVFPCIFRKRCIRRVGEHYIVKYGEISLDEAENMHFVAENCGPDAARIMQAATEGVDNSDGGNGTAKADDAAVVGMIVPKLYAAFHDTETNSNFIIMEYVPGKSLEEAWNTLGRAGRARITKHLNAQFAAVRNIAPDVEDANGCNTEDYKHKHNHKHGGHHNYNANGNTNARDAYYGRLGRRPYNDIFLGSSTLPCGPFNHESQLNEAFYQRYASLHPDLATGRGAFYRERVFPKILKGHPPVFTHGDLQAKNILVREADGLPVVVDWECAAWYPSYWEYTNALWTSRRWGDEWWGFVGDVLGGGEGEFVVEFKCVENLMGDLLDETQPGVEGWGQGWDSCLSPN
ncbi:kinase-like domain-containing protein [Coniella lustricola]|uniref:Kinase-like domain-containing protein n=1 Tax=Coniella lustricola TaxID=2025994 RepID=A0A2T3AF40_9PEZI|nr:kinase-like domain-containing protein [Coniella lustricola]